MEHRRIALLVTTNRERPKDGYNGYKGANKEE